ncbi:hypothetical protein QWY85_02320 [Neolewinella lacunae]|uniref:Uncharacterized protein n=1 Tax=Neolewinella lacunae TaxID=1517758 RepID=A0A923PN58_9BACT|nr:hypothetical protein [Neolewinella lacunae]MBC6993592.1 hypothetical protein [Neolewinella lacunae]MDN3633476.1 hypothetical protein [Neolewinella lacunae]
MLRYYPLYLSFFVFILGCDGCNDDCFDMTDPACINYDFCLAQEEVSAEFEAFLFIETNPFETGEIIRIESPIMDTTYPGRIYFRALSEDATGFDWMVGSDPRMVTTKEWDLGFPALTGRVEIRLTAERELSRCPERGLETSTSARDIFILDHRFNSPVPYLGRYLGNNASEPDSAQFEIEFFLSRPSDGKVEIRNFPRNARNNGRFNNLGIVSNYKSFIISPTPNICCDRAHGTGVFSDDKRSLRIVYRTFDFERQVWVDDVWTGSRVE